ncbi:MAG: hypothetical protein JXL84_19595 [Deltaproteobacteria bacterium]|nr:hypothetical protein [Deltaproteobacteria bacterium]
MKGKWIGTDNADAFNRCAAHCRKTGMTMLVPKGNYGLASTVWLTNPEMDGLKQASITVMGTNRGAFLDMLNTANLCVLPTFKAGKMIQAKKLNGTQSEPNLIPVLGISNGRQVHIEGIGIHGNNKEDLLCGIAIGNVTQMVSIRNCSLHNLFAGVVFPGLRPSPTESVSDGNNDLLLVELSTFENAYNIVCAGTQPFSCAYRSNRFAATRSIFMGTLMTNHWGHSRGSHRFTSNLFGSKKGKCEEPMVYFDLALNEVTIDSNHFETGFGRGIPEVLLRSMPKGGSRGRTERMAFTNNIVNFMNVNKNPTKHRPLFDVMTGSPMIIQGNHFRLGTAARIKASNAVMIGNTFHLAGPHDLSILSERHVLAGKPGDVLAGRYDFNHFIRRDSKVTIRLPSGEVLTRGKHYRLHLDENAFETTAAGKREIDRAEAVELLVSYSANDAVGIRQEAWGGNAFNPPHGWQGRTAVSLGNKMVGKDDRGKMVEGDLRGLAGRGYGGDGKNRQAD